MKRPKGLYSLESLLPLYKRSLCIDSMIDIDSLEALIDDIIIALVIP